MISQGDSHPDAEKEHRAVLVTLAIFVSIIIACVAIGAICLGVLKLIYGTPC